MIADAPESVLAAPLRNVIVPVQGTVSSETIHDMQRIISAAPQVQMPLAHEFIPPVGETMGAYRRTIFIPAGTITVTKIHRKPSFFVILMGSVSVWNKNHPEHIAHLSAPFQGITEAGTQRVIQVHTDTIWQTTHVTNETDLAKIEAELIEPYVAPADSPCTT